MEFKVIRRPLKDIPSELAVVGQFEEGPSPILSGIDRKIRGKIHALNQSGEFKGKFLQVTVLHLGSEISIRRLLLVGLGKKKEFCLDRVRQAMGKAAVRVQQLRLSSFSIDLMSMSLPQMGLSVVAQAAAEGIVLGTYCFDRYKTEPEEASKAMDTVVAAVPDGRRMEEVRQGLSRGRLIAQETNFARDLCNSPSNIVTPSRLAEEAKRLSSAYGMRLEILDRPELEAMGMGAFMGVARGTQEPPKLIVLEYSGAKRPGRPIALVGKAVTFDSGGISLKPAEHMEQMKYDMSGGAAVLGTLSAVAQLRLPVNVVGILPATDNMPSGTALHPGDVLKSLSGKTIEVINTDAEGRLCLADALSFASRYRPSAVIDLATLTGACVIALGHHAIGLLGNDRKLIDRIRQAGELSGERVWELPLWPEYDEQIKSDIADLKNTGGRAAGTITAGAFLKPFADPYPWVHLDIAGTAWSEQMRPYTPKGSTGVGVRLLVQFLSDRIREGK